MVPKLKYYKQDNWKLKYIIAKIYHINFELMNKRYIQLLVKYLKIY